MVYNDCLIFSGSLFHISVLLQSIPYRHTFSDWPRSHQATGCMRILICSLSSYISVGYIGTKNSLGSVLVDKLVSPNFSCTANTKKHASLTIEWITVYENCLYYFTINSLSVLSLAKSPQLILEISTGYKLN